MILSVNLKSYSKLTLVERVFLRDTLGAKPAWILDWQGGPNVTNISFYNF